MLKYSQLISDLKRGSILPLYLFYGEEAFLMQEAVDLIIRKVVDPGARDFNFNTVYCRETPATELVNLCETLPFMSARRLVIAKELDAYKAADLETLSGYLKSPSPSTCLVMVSNQRKYDKKNVTSAVEPHGAVTAFYPLLDRELSGWILDRARARKLSIRPDAAQYLQQIIGNDLQKLNNEIEKVEIYIKEKKEISFDDVKAVVGDFREYTSFDLADAVGRKNRGKAFLILSRLIQEGEQPVGLLGSIAWNFRRLMRAKAMEAGGMGFEEIKKKLNVIFHQSASFHEQMKSFSAPELKRVFEAMLQADKSLKSSGLEGRLILERMILRVCGAQPL